MPVLQPFVPTASDIDMSRLQTLHDVLHQQHIDAIALSAGPTLTWLTGAPFEAHERLFLVIVPYNSVPVVLLPAIEVDRWNATVSFECEVVSWDDAHGYEAALAQTSRRLPPPRTVAIEHGIMRVFEYEAVKRICPTARLAEAKPLVRALRGRKDEHGIAATRRAVEITERALGACVNEVQPGMTERSVAARLTALLLEGGGETIPFGPVVLSGPRSALPHGTVTDREIAPGDFLLIDCGVTFSGYHSDITRTFVVGGEPDAEQQRIYEAVQAANERGRDACGPGTTPHLIHHACQDALRAPEFSAYARHRTGHGIGLEIHEPPSVVRGNRDPIEPGMIITIEPGLYREGWGGVRIEDDVLIAEAGAEVLSQFPRTLRVLGA